MAFRIHVSRTTWLLALALVALPLAGSTQIARALVEKPDYEVLERAKGYYVRRYPACIVARVEVEAPAGDAMNKGFKPLADFIFGENVDASKIAMTSPVVQEKAPSTKIAMTSPVVQEPAEGGAMGTHWVSFIMPSEYTLESLPKPKSDRVQIEAIPERIVAVRRFGWTGKHKHMVKQEGKLREALARDGVEVAGPPTYARYDPPWTLALFRRNEVMLPVLWEAPQAAEE